MGEHGWHEAVQALRDAQQKGIDQSLEPVRALLGALGDPDLRFDALQIVGTNGKSSTARYVAAILRGEGLRVGLFVSPMLVSYADQIELDGAPVARDVFAAAVHDVVRAGKKINAERAQSQEEPLPFTEFELLTVVAAVVFARSGMDVVVFEAGLGGAWDATSAMRSIRSVAVTGIGLDHTRILGATLTDIARQKAAVIKRGRTCVLGRGATLVADVASVFLERARHEQINPIVVWASSDARAQAPRAQVVYKTTLTPTRLGAPLQLSVQTPRSTYEGIGALKPAYQAENIACAIALAEAHLGHSLDHEALFDSVVCCATPGRFDLVRPKPLVLVDACHNPQSVEAFVRAVQDVEPCVQNRPQLLCAVLADKDVDGMVALLCHEFPSVVVAQTSSPRALAAPELARAFERHGVTPAATFQSIPLAMEALKDEAFVACGSITTAGEVAAYFGRE